MAVAAVDSPVPSPAVLTALLLALAGSSRELGLINPEGRPALELLSAPDLAERARTAAARSPLVGETAGLDPIWTLAAVTMLLHRELAAAPERPEQIGSLAAARVFAAALEMARVVPGLEAAAAELARLAA